MHTESIHFYKCLGTLPVAGESKIGYRVSFVKKISCLNNYIEVQVTVPFQFFRYFRKQIYSHFQISFFSKNPYLNFSDFNFSIFPKTNIFTFSDFIFFEKSVFKFFRFHFFENPKINIFKFSDFIFFENPYLNFQISIFSKIRI